MVIIFLVHDGWLWNFYWPIYRNASSFFHILSIYPNTLRFVSMQDVDYEATLATKLSIAKKIFALEKDLILHSKSFQKYFSENEVFMSLELYCCHLLAAFGLNLFSVALFWNLIAILNYVF